MNTIEYFRMRNRLLIEQEKKMQSLAYMPASARRKEVVKYNNDFYSKLAGHYNKLDVCRYSGEPLNKQ